MTRLDALFVPNNILDCHISDKIKVQTATLASSASNGASRTQSQTCLSYAEAQPIECNVVANEASLFGTCKSFWIYL